MSRAPSVPRRMAAPPQRTTGTGWQLALMSVGAFLGVSVVAVAIVIADVTGSHATPASSVALPELPPRDPGDLQASLPVQTPTPTVPAPTATATPSPTRAPSFAYTAPAPPRDGAIIERAAAYAPNTELQRALTEEIGDDPSMSIVVISPEGDVIADLHGGTQWYAASLFKLSILYHALLLLDLDLVTLEDRVPITGEAWAEDLGTAGSLQVADDGTVSLGHGLEMMVTISDNTSAVALLSYFGHEEIDETVRSVGATSTSVNTTELPTTAEDMAFIMDAIVHGKGLGPEVRAYGRELLLAQTIREGIPSGLPDGVTVGNKTGTWDGATHDVAFIDTDRGTYVLAVLTSWGYGSVQEVARVAYEHLR